MHGSVRLALILLLLACNDLGADKKAAAAAELFTRAHARRSIEASVAGSDCRVLLIRIDTECDKNLVESIHYGTGSYATFGGAEQFAHDRGFRAVVYRNANGGIWTYGATTLDEAREIPKCR